MTFLDIIDRWPSPQDLAADLDLPAKNVRRWVDIGSIPSEWFVAVEKAARNRGFRDINIKALAAAAHERRLAKVTPDAANDTASREQAA